MPTYNEQLASFHRVKRELLHFIDQVRQQQPDAADYLEKHLVMDDKNFTFCYTGDDRFRMQRVSHPAPEQAKGRSMFSS